MSKQLAAYYFVHHTVLAREKCSWKREYFELRADGVLTSVAEYEDLTFLATAWPRLGLPWGVVLSTRAEYRAAKARQLRAQRAAEHKARAQREAAKLLRSGMQKSQHAAEEAGAAEAVGQLGQDVRVVSALSAVSVAPVVEVPADVLADYTVFDCETTGLSAETDHLLELAATRYTGGKPVDSMQSFVRFTGWIPPKITQLTGIQASQVAHAPECKDVLRAFRKLAGDSLLVGHNVGFDLRFVNAARTRLGATEPLPNSFLCTQVVAKAVLPGLPSYALGKLCARFNISAVKAHRAGADVLMTAKLLEQLHAKRPLTPELVNATGAPKPAKPAAEPLLFA